MSYGFHAGSGFTPYKAPTQPELPPSGSYDPALDAARAAASRGLLDTQQDVGLNLGRAGQDFAIGTQDYRDQFSRQRTGYDQNTAALKRSFNILAGQQAQAQRQAGVSSGGAVLQARGKRAGNQAIAQQGLDTQLNNARAARDRGIGGLGLGYNRQVTDLTTTGLRAQREDTQFGLDTNAQRYFQAAQYGWEPQAPQAHPQPPRSPLRRRRPARGTL